jgi:hypothetical protein
MAQRQLVIDVLGFISYLRTVDSHQVSGRKHRVPIQWNEDLFFARLNLLAVNLDMYVYLSSDILMLINPLL